MDAEAAASSVGQESSIVAGTARARTIKVIDIVGAFYLFFLGLGLSALTFTLECTWTKIVRLQKCCRGKNKILLTLRSPRGVPKT